MCTFKILILEADDQQATESSRLLLKIALLMESIFFLDVNDCYLLPDIRCLPLQQVAFMYKFRREVYVDTGSLLFQQVFVRSVHVST